MEAKRECRSHPRTKTMDQRLAEIWGDVEFMLFLTAGILFIGFVEAL